MPRPAGNIILDMVKRLCKLCPMMLSCDELAKDIYVDINMLRKCFNPNPITVDWQQLDAAHKQKFGENVPGIYYDGKYWVPAKDALLKWVSLDWTNYENYIIERFDCDDFARVFKAHVLEIFGVNAIGYAVGEIRDQNNNLVGYHAWNILVWHENGNIKLVCYEPQDDSVSENCEFVVSGEKWKYIPYWVEY